MYIPQGHNLGGGSLDPMSHYGSVRIGHVIFTMAKGSASKIPGQSLATELQESLALGSDFARPACGPTGNKVKVSSLFGNQEVEEAASVARTETILYIPCDDIILLILVPSKFRRPSVRVGVTRTSRYHISIHRLFSCL